jgi:D-tyrosyl-tRNA(Tyr) deacylase
MRAVVQRVSEASVEVEGRTVGKIGPGYLVLLGIGRDDTEQAADLIADRIIGMRVFADAEGKMNLALEAVGGQLLIVSQFTLFADTNKGRRPSFVAAAPPDLARPLYEHFVAHCRAKKIGVATGDFGANMQIKLICDGPVTIVLDSSQAPI